MPWRRQNGLSLLEFTLAVLTIAVLTLMAFDRIAAVRSEMERAGVQQTVAAMRGALALQFAEFVVTGELDQLERRDGANALELLAPPPVDYRGERVQVNANVAPGSWYYARESAVIAYRPRYPLAFDDPGGRLYWRVIARRDGRADRDELALVRSTATGRPLAPQDNRPENEQATETQP